MTLIQMRRGTAAAWTAANPILAAGEWGDETDTGKVKIGNGVLTWATLPYVTDTVGSGTATALATKVAKGDLVVNVADYGAVNDWVPTGVLAGGTGTDNTAAIAAARTAVLAKGLGATLYFPGGTGKGYKTTAKLELSTATNLIMDAPLIYAGAGAEPAISVALDLAASPTTPHYRTYRLSVQRATRSDWTNELDVGIRLSGLQSCFVTIAQVQGFTVGLSTVGDTAKGYVYNHHWLGEIRDNRYGVDVVADSGGWNNENTYYGGSFAAYSTTHNTLDRVGVRFRSPSTYGMNSNVFFRPCFEMGGQVIAGEGLPVLIEYGLTNRFLECRMEGTDSIAIRTQNTAANNYVSVLYVATAAELTVDDQGANPSTILRVAGNQMPDESTRYIVKIDALHKRACFYNGGTTYHIPGLTMCSSATTLTEGRSLAGVTMAADYLSISPGVVLGLYVDTRVCKQFLLNCATTPSFGGRYIVRCYDSAGVVITTAGAAKANGGSLTYATSYGGAFRTGSDSNSPKLITVTAAVAYVFVGINGGSAACQVSTFAVTALSDVTPATWTAQYDGDDANRGTVAPTAGTWEVGRQVLNAAPAAGQPDGWVCTVAGTPGTWVSMPTTTGAAPSDPTVTNLTVGTSTWTIPAGARRFQVILQGAGGGGGAGRRGAAAAIRGGGGGGGGGQCMELRLGPADITSPVAYTVGAGGTVGAAATADDTTGGAGGIGGVTSFNTVWTARGGGGGGGGTLTAGGAGGAASSPGPNSGGSGSITATAGSPGGTAVIASAFGGSGGGGITAGNVASAGGVNYGRPEASGYASVVGGTGGAAGTNGGTTAQTIPASPSLPGAGGSGGGASTSGTDVGGTGGAGVRGGGGGGGGASTNGANSGAGGAGADGFIQIITYFD